MPSPAVGSGVFERANVVGVVVHRFLVTASFAFVRRTVPPGLPDRLRESLASSRPVTKLEAVGDGGVRVVGARAEDVVGR
jgi:hypothetical protein